MEKSKVLMVCYGFGMDFIQANAHVSQGPEDALKAIGIVIFGLYRVYSVEPWGSPEP